MKKLLYITILLAAADTISCKKDKKNAYNGTAPSKTGSTLDLIRDSVFLYAKEAYYWYDALPSYASFNPRSFAGSTDLAALTKEVDAISQYKINPNTGQPYEYYSGAPGEAKYSFIDEGQVSTELNGSNNNFGFAPLYNDVNDLRVKYVYPGSPADLAGVKRGYKIISINGNSDIAYDGGSGPHTQFVINAYSGSNTITMVLQKSDLSTITVNLTAAAYTTNPVITYKTFNVGNGKVIGYVVFNTFTSEANADAKLDAAFNYFQSQGITDLVVDLRYNGGGYVATAEYLDNLIVPIAKTGATMYSYYFNDILASNKEVLLGNQVRREPSTNQLYNYGQFSYTVADNTTKFTKKGSLNIGRVFFIVTGSTASASELTINNLRPHLDVQLIGTTSYGKPVGFFDIDINKYQLYIPEFETKNSAGQGGYYTGMTPGSAEYPGVKDYDDVTKEFGDTTETLLHHAVNYVRRGIYSSPTERIQGLSGRQKTFSIDQANAAAIELNGNKFSGMITKKTFKNK
ncbi:S41 family peptidase [Mucilaginibacter sp. UR6-11]|uniref:S41 family peptidase n=1 Tax=Mucilaginibacter sp. UR6-11 TaxID=1435644 RepID=UPI001E39E104|nr:S41 family peptidase [Mucilaginibacter sp. UR6-11]MCC8425981.1 PDZ domain-containing protein [Mucilaginibacter sp. UR6-11]